MKHGILFLIELSKGVLGSDWSNTAEGRKVVGLIEVVILEMALYFWEGEGRTIVIKVLFDLPPITETP